MTPIPAYIRLSDHSLRATATGEAVPTVSAILRNKLRLDLNFVDGATVRSLASGSSGKLVVKKIGDQAGDALALDTTWEPLATSTEQGSPLKYRMETLMDSTELRAALGTAKRLLLSYAVEWTESGETQTTADYELELWNTSARPDDGTPTAPSTFWTRLKAALAAGTGVSFADNEGTQVRTINVTAGTVSAAAIATAVNGSTAKTNLNGNDALGLVDSEASNGPKKTTLTSLYNWLKGLFDSAYSLAGHTHGIDGVVALQAALDDKADAADLADKADTSSLNSHIGDTDNPHSVTATQLGTLRVQRITGNADYYQVLAADGSTDGYLPRITTLDA